MSIGLGLELICGIDNLPLDEQGKPAWTVKPGVGYPDDWQTYYDNEGEHTVRVQLPALLSEEDVERIIRQSDKTEYMQEIDNGLFRSMLAEDEEEPDLGKKLEDVLYHAGASLYPPFQEVKRGHIVLPEDGPVVRGVKLERYRYFPHFEQERKITQYLFGYVGLIVPDDEIKLILAWSWE